MSDQQKFKEINNQLIAKTFSGLEFVLAKELKDLGALNVRTLRRGVRFEGNKEMMYKANYYCRSAIRILRNIALFDARDENELYEGIKSINWERFIPINKTFAIDAITSDSNIKHSHYASLKSKDAIVDQFREKYGKRPNINARQPDIQINIRIFRDECSVSLDSSGESLHKRGYRTETGPAPINEVLAAGMVLLSGWDKKSPFLDPMCGSGTIAIEAGMIANNIPPGMYRNHFGFQSWQDFDPELWHEVKSAFEAPEKFLQVEGSDKSGILISKSRKNIDFPFLRDIINLRPSYFEDTKAKGTKGMIIMNPPYGERLKVDRIQDLYKSIGQNLKENYKGYSAWLITSDQKAIRSVGLKPSKTITLFNGKLESVFVRFDLYSGELDKSREDKDFKKSNTRSFNKKRGQGFSKPKGNKRGNNKFSGKDRENRNSRFKGEKQSGQKRKFNKGKK